MALIQNLLEFSYAHQHGPIHVVQHVHHFSQFDVILEGSMVLLAGGKQRVLRPGDSTLIPPLCRHGFEILQSVRHASFKAHIHPQYSAMVGTQARIARLADEQLAVARTAGRWFEANSPLNLHGALAAATYYLVHLLQHHPPEAQQHDSSLGISSELRELLSQIIAQPHANWSVRRMAERCHVSEGHFTKSFVRSFGQTPQRFLLEARIWDAADRLGRDEVSIKSVAQSIGYATVHSFTRAFKRAMGISPAAYVRSQGKL